MAEYFLTHGTQVIGTIRDNRRHFPTELKSLNLDKVAAAFYEHNSLVITKDRARKDKSTWIPKILYILSTAHTPAMSNTSKKDKKGNIVQRPACIIAYNHYVGGDDMMGQQLDVTEVLRKMNKWYKILLLTLVMQCVLSLYVLHKLKGGKMFFSILFV